MSYNAISSIGTDVSALARLEWTLEAHKKAVLCSEDRDEQAVLIADYIGKYGLKALVIVSSDARRRFYKGLSELFTPIMKTVFKKGDNREVFARTFDLLVLDDIEDIKGMEDVVSRELERWGRPVAACMVPRRETRSFTKRTVLQLFQGALVRMSDGELLGSHGTFADQPAGDRDNFLYVQGIIAMQDREKRARAYYEKDIAELNRWLAENEPANVLRRYMPDGPQGKCLVLAGERNCSYVIKRGLRKAFPDIPIYTVGFASIDKDERRHRIAKFHITERCFLVWDVNEPMCSLKGCDSIILAGNTGLISSTNNNRGHVELTWVEKFIRRQYTDTAKLGRKFTVFDFLFRRTDALEAGRHIVSFSTIEQPGHGSPKRYVDVDIVDLVSEYLLLVVPQRRSYCVTIPEFAVIRQNMPKLGVLEVKKRFDLRISAGQVGHIGIKLGIHTKEYTVLGNKVRKYTKEEDALIKRYYPYIGAKKVQALMPYRTVKSIQLRASRLGLAKEGVKYWTPEEGSSKGTNYVVPFADKLIRELYARYGDAENATYEVCRTRLSHEIGVLAEKLGCTRKQLTGRAARLGLRFRKASPPWTLEEEAIIYENYINVDKEHRLKLKELAELLPGKTTSQINKKIRELRNADQ